MLSFVEHTVTRWGFRLCRADKDVKELKEKFLRGKMLPNLVSCATCEFSEISFLLFCSYFTLQFVLILLIFFLFCFLL